MARDASPIRAVMESQGRTIDEIAAKTGWNASRVSRLISHGEGSPALIAAVADVLRCDPGWLLRECVRLRGGRPKSPVGGRRG